jgi:hypothetical protein
MLFAFESRQQTFYFLLPRIVSAAGLSQNDARWVRNISNDSWFAQPGEARINPKGTNVAAVLIRNVQHITGSVDSEVARAFTGTSVTN